MKKISWIVLLASLPALGYAQTLDDLRALNAKSKTLYIKAEALDQLMIQFRPFESIHGNGMDSLVMDTYKTVAKGYSDNNHFRQAYDVYNRYLNYKSDFLANDRKQAISKAGGSIAERSSKDQSNQLDKKNQFEQLQIDNDQLSTKKRTFQRYSTFGIVALSILFAAMLVRAGIRYNNLKSSIKKDRARMLELQRLAVLGAYIDGYKETLKRNLAESDAQAQKVRQGLKQITEKDADKASNLASSVSKSIQEINTNLK